MHLLEVQSISVEYVTRRGNVKAVDDVSLFLDSGEMLGLVGESGSGKSTLGLSIMRLLPPSGRIVGGRILLDGVDLAGLSEEEMRHIRGNKIAYVFQDPMTSLNPVKKIGEHFVELVRTHRPDATKEDALESARKALKDVGIPPERINDYPHQFSGEMRQRIMIALAIGLNPRLVIADEPTTALDVIVQAKILDLLNELRKKYGMGVILITHDLSIVLERAHRISVMYAGSIVESATARDIHRDPRHPYTQGLLQSIPNIELDSQELEAIPGSPPNLLDPPSGCRFWPRCRYADEICKNKVPAAVEVAPGHLVRCFREVNSI